MRLGRATSDDRESVPASSAGARKGDRVSLESASLSPQTTRRSWYGAVNLRPSGELFLISFFILFFELACIRWLGSIVIFLTFFTNIVLMACFLGVSVGCLAASRRWSWMSAVVPLAIVTTASAGGFLWAYNAFSQVMIDVGSQQSPQLIYFGTDARVKDPSKWVVPMEILAAYFFVLVALMFVGPGQEMGRRFAAIENRVVAYTADIVGSLAGITVFGLMSFFRVPAWAWFLIAMGIAVGLVSRRRAIQAVGSVVVLALVLLADWPRDMNGVATEVIWSPYYQVRFKPRYLSIDVNNLGHQGMLPVDRAGPAYFLPHLLNRDAGGKRFDNVLMIGAGSGNDVAAALSLGAGHVDAVEIDPVINELGRIHHPNRPYSDPRVTIHLDDGRGFVRRTPSHYDLISYAVVDSLALHSSYSSVRLESFLFTEQAFRDIKAKLKPGGVFAMYNFYRQGWVVGRLVRLAETVFGSRPLVISLPYQDVIAPNNNQRDFITFLLVGEKASAIVESIRAKFASDGFFWLNPQPRFNMGVNGFGAVPPVVSTSGAPRFTKIGPAEVELAPGDRMPTDAWPFLYLREPTIPALNLRGMMIVAVLSMAILFAFAPMWWANATATIPEGEADSRAGGEFGSDGASSSGGRERTLRPSGRMFFLGAGFMLLETKGVVHMALLFGGTWVVNSIVFFAILTMILFSNLYVLLMRPRRLWPYYVLLLAALVVNSVVPIDDFLELPGSSKVMGSCAVVFLPVFFAGVIFASAFRSSRRPDVDFGSNIAGIILGGLSENLSLVLGFNHLLWVAIGYYLLSALLRPRQTQGA
jgi:SAM-dependent methyltransferase